MKQSIKSSSSTSNDDDKSGKSQKTTKSYLTNLESVTEVNDNFSMRNLNFYRAN